MRLSATEAAARVLAFRRALDRDATLSERIAQELAPMAACLALIEDCRPQRVDEYAFSLVRTDQALRQAASPLVTCLARGLSDQVNDFVLSGALLATGQGPEDLAGLHVGAGRVGRHRN